VVIWGMGLKNLFRLFRSPEPPLNGGPGTIAEPAADGEFTPDLIYIYLPGSIEPLDRGDRFEDPIDEELQRLGLGQVSGGGSQLGSERADGTRMIEFCGIDVDTNDVDGARETLRMLLPKLGCPARTQLHYREAESPLQDEYDGSEWRLARKRSLLHPGFGI
jgi:hypothetical protein